MTDEEKAQKAMYHLEGCFHDGVSAPPWDEVEIRMWAAFYLIQSMFGGTKPDNYDETMRDVDELDAREEAEHAILMAKVQ